MSDLGDRTQYLGGSDAAPVLGVSPFATALDVYLQKVGEAAPTEQSEPMRWGNLLEPVILAEYGRRTGHQVLPGPEIRLQAEPYLRLHLDGLVPGRVVEAKTSRDGRDWGEPGTDEIPIYYVPQVQLYMRGAGVRYADVAVLIGASDFRIYTVERDDALTDGIIARARAFWNGHVIPRTPPPPANLADVRALFRRDAGGVQIANETVFAAAQALAQAKAAIKRAESEAEQLEYVIQSAMGDAAELVTPAGDRIATWKCTKPSRRFDAAAFKAAHPDLYDAHCVESVARRFLLKLKGEE